MNREMDTHKEDGQYFTVIQPIVSGDRELKTSLRTNVLNTSNVNFVWVVDQKDEEARRITKELKEELKRDIRILIADDFEPYKNEKVLKQKMALSYCRDYVIAMDDDTVIRFDRLSAIKKQLDTKECVLTALPFYRQSKGFLGNLVVGFVNGNTMITYLVLAKLNKTHSLNGMCYFAKKDTLSRLKVFEKVEERLADEYEIAKVLEKNKVEIIQEVIPCETGTTIKELSHYISLMKRWMVFANIYMYESISPSTFIAIVIPTLLPLITFGLGLFIGAKGVLLYVATQLSIGIMNYRARSKYLEVKEKFTMILYESLASLIQPLHYMNSLINPRVIIWRKNRVTIKKSGDLVYERIEG